MKTLKLIAVIVLLIVGSVITANGNPAGLLIGFGAVVASKTNIKGLIEKLDVAWAKYSADYQGTDRITGFTKIAHDTKTFGIWLTYIFKVVSAPTMITKSGKTVPNYDKINEELKQAGCEYRFYLGFTKNGAPCPQMFKGEFVKSTQKSTVPAPSPTFASLSL